MTEDDVEDPQRKRERERERGSGGKEQAKAE